MDDSGIENLALASAAARIDWPGRGRSPTGYVAGMAVSYARVSGARVCGSNRPGDVQAARHR